MAGYYVPKGDPSTLPPKGLTTREEHIKLREPVTRARHARLAEEAAKNQNPKSLADVKLPEGKWRNRPFFQNGVPYNTSGWLLPNGQSNPGWEASKAMRQAIFQQAVAKTGFPMTNSLSKAPTNPTFSHAEAPDKPTAKKGSTKVIWQEPAWMAKR